MTSFKKSADYKPGDRVVWKKRKSQPVAMTKVSDKTAPDSLGRQTVEIWKDPEGHLWHPHPETFERGLSDPDFLPLADSAD